MRHISTCPLFGRAEKLEKVYRSVPQLDLVIVVTWSVVPVAA
jgi:hypothetical protein